MNILAYGGGVNSTALAVEFTNRGIPIDLILFADTGGERPETYAYIKTFSKWLVERGQPEIVTVKRVNRAGDVRSLEKDCLDGNMLPSIAYGFKSCSIKYKRDPQNKYCNNNNRCKSIWAAGGKPVKLIGYDADETRRANIQDDDKYEYQYPLIDWEWGRDECLQAIKAAGLCDPGKSSCFFCPSMKAHEIKRLAFTNPDLMARALAMEANADTHTIKGLGRQWAWKDLLATADMFEDEFINTIDESCGCCDG